MEDEERVREYREMRMMNKRFKQADEEQVTACDFGIVVLLAPLSQLLCSNCFFRPMRLPLSPSVPAACGLFCWWLIGAAMKFFCTQNKLWALLVFFFLLSSSLVEII